MIPLLSSDALLTSFLHWAPHFTYDISLPTLTSSCVSVDFIFVGKQLHKVSFFLRKNTVFWKHKRSVCVARVETNSKLREGKRKCTGAFFSRKINTFGSFHSSFGAEFKQQWCVFNIYYEAQFPHSMYTTRFKTCAILSFLM